MMKSSSMLRKKKKKIVGRRSNNTRSSRRSSTRSSNSSNRSSSRSSRSGRSGGGVIVTPEDSTYGKSGESSHDAEGSVTLPVTLSSSSSSSSSSKGDHDENDNVDSQLPSSSSSSRPAAAPKSKSRKQRRRTQKPLFAFTEIPSQTNDDASSADAANDASANDTFPNTSSTTTTTPARHLPRRSSKRKLKSIARFDPAAHRSRSETYPYHQQALNNAECRTGEGFLCAGCGAACSYDSRRCAECGLECYYEAGVGVVTLKERRSGGSGNGGSGSGGGGVGSRGRKRRRGSSSGRNAKRGKHHVVEAGEASSSKEETEVLDNDNAAVSAELKNGECDVKQLGTTVRSPGGGGVASSTTTTTTTTMMTDASRSNEKQPMTMMDDDDVTNRTTSKSSKKRRGRSAGKSASKSIGKLGKDDDATVVDRVVDRLDRASRSSSTAPSAAADDKGTSAPSAESTDDDADPTATASSSGGGSSSSSSPDATSSANGDGTAEDTTGVSRSDRKGSAMDDVELSVIPVAASESAATSDSASSVVAAASSSDDNDGDDGDACRDEETTAADARGVGAVASSKDDDATNVGNGRGIRDDRGRDHRRHHHRRVPTGQQQQSSDAESSSRSSVRPKRIGRANERRAPTLGRLGRVGGDATSPTRAARERANHPSEGEASPAAAAAAIEGTEVLAPATEPRGDDGGGNDRRRPPRRESEGRRDPSRRSPRPDDGAMPFVEGNAEDDAGGGGAASEPEERATSPHEAGADAPEERATRVPSSGGGGEDGKRANAAREDVGRTTESTSTAEANGDGDASTEGAPSSEAVPSARRDDAVAGASTSVGGAGGGEASSAIPYGVPSEGGAGGEGVRRNRRENSRSMVVAAATGGDAVDGVGAGGVAPETRGEGGTDETMANPEILRSVSSAATAAKSIAFDNKTRMASSNDFVEVASSSRGEEVGGEGGSIRETNPENPRSLSVASVENTGSKSSAKSIASKTTTTTMVTNAPVEMASSRQCTADDVEGGINNQSDLEKVSPSILDSAGSDSSAKRIASTITTRANAAVERASSGRGEEDGGEGGKNKQTSPENPLPVPTATFNKTGCKSSAKREGHASKNTAMVANAPAAKKSPSGGGVILQDALAAMNNKEEKAIDQQKLIFKQVAVEEQPPKRQLNKRGQKVRWGHQITTNKIDGGRASNDPQPKSKIPAPQRPGKMSSKILPTSASGGGGAANRQQFIPIVGVAREQPPKQQPGKTLSRGRQAIQNKTNERHAMNELKAQRILAPVLPTRRAREQEHRPNKAMRIFAIEPDDKALPIRQARPRDTSASEPPRLPKRDGIFLGGRWVVTNKTEGGQETIMLAPKRKEVSFKSRHETIVLAPKKKPARERDTSASEPPRLPKRDGIFLGGRWVVTNKTEGGRETIMLAPKRKEVSFKTRHETIVLAPKRKLVAESSDENAIKQQPSKQAVLFKSVTSSQYLDQRSAGEEDTGKSGGRQANTHLLGGRHGGKLSDDELEVDVTPESEGGFESVLSASAHGQGPRTVADQLLVQRTSKSEMVHPGGRQAITDGTEVTHLNNGQRAKRYLTTKAYDENLKKRDPNNVSFLKAKQQSESCEEGQHARSDVMKGAGRVAASRVDKGTDVSATVARDSNKSISPVGETSSPILPFTESKRRDDATDAHRISTGPRTDKEQLIELQAKYNTLLSRTTKSHKEYKSTISKLNSTIWTKVQAAFTSEQRYKSTISKLKSSLATKEQALTCADATVVSLRGRTSALQEDIARISAERNELAKKSASLNPHDSNLVNGSTPLPRHLTANMPEDVSNCSSEIEELQSKMEELIDQRDSAEEQVKELQGVQLQKDELLVKLQYAQNRLEVIESARKEEREDFAEQEQWAMDQAASRQKRICQLEAMLEVVTSQRDRANSRVSNFLLSGIGRGNTKGMEKVLSTFRSENRALANNYQARWAELCILKCDKVDAVNQSAKLKTTVAKLQAEVEALQSQNNKLQHSHTFCPSFRSEHNGSRSDLDDEKKYNNLDGNLPLDNFLSDAEGTGADIFLEPPIAASDTDKGEETDKTEVDELAKTLDSLHDFDEFLTDLGIENGQG